MSSGTYGLLAAAALTLAGSAAWAANGDTLKAVKERGNLLCTGHDGSYLGFAEVDNKGEWQGIDIALCRAVAEDPRVTSSGFATLPAPPSRPARIGIAAPKPLRTLRRIIEQGVGHVVHEVRYVRDLIAVTVNSSRWGKVLGGVFLAVA